MGKKQKSCLTTDMKKCLLCGSPYVEIHHVFFGVANRKLSDRYGYIVPLCATHHRLGHYAPHTNRDCDLMLKRIAQEHFEQNNGTREDFIRIFGRSYL